MASKRNQKRKASRMEVIKNAVAMLMEPKKVKLSKEERIRRRLEAEHRKAVQQGEDWLNWVDYLLTPRKRQRTIH